MESATAARWRPQRVALSTSCAKSMDKEEERAPARARSSRCSRPCCPLLPGRALVAGFDVVTQPGEVRKRIGYVPQLLSADGELTGYENLLLSSDYI